MRVYANSLTLVQQTDEKATINVSVPKIGRYSLDIYTEEKGCINSGKRVCACCLSYIIEAEHEIEYSEFVGYPEVYEVIAAMCDFVIEVESQTECRHEEQVEMKVKANKLGSKFSHYICSGKVSSDSDVPNEAKLRCNTSETIDKCNPNLRSFKAVLPSKGWWTIFLVDKASSYVLMRYQVCTTSDCRDHVLYPYVTGAAQELGISLQDRSLCHMNGKRPFSLNFSALYGLYYQVKLTEMKEVSQPVDTSKSSTECKTLGVSQNPSQSLVRMRRWVRV